MLSFCFHLKKQVFFVRVLVDFNQMRVCRYGSFVVRFHFLVSFVFVCLCVYAKKFHFTHFFSKIRFLLHY